MQNIYISGIYKNIIYKYNLSYIMMCCTDSEFYIT